MILTNTCLCLGVNETDSMLVDGNQQDLRKIWLCGLLKTENNVVCQQNLLIICKVVGNMPIVS